MVNFLDKFLTGTALSYAWIQMLLCVWAIVAWLDGGPRRLLFVVALGAAGMLFEHGVVGMSVGPILAVALALALVARARLAWLPAPGRLVLALVALAAGAALAGPYTWSISRGWQASQSGLAHRFLTLDGRMAWTIVTACGVVGALAIAPARRLLAERNGPGAVFVLATLGALLFGLLVDLPMNNEAKFVFHLFFLLAILAGPAFGPWLTSLRRRLPAPAFGALFTALFLVPFSLTIFGFTVDRTGDTDARTTMSAAELRLYRWLHDHTPKNAVIVDEGFRNWAMVFARRQMFCGSPAGPDLAGLPADDAADRHRVQADLYGPGAELERDAERVSRFGRPVFLIVRGVGGADSATAPAFTRRPDMFVRLYEAEGFAVYGLRAGVRDGSAAKSASQRASTSAMPKRSTISGPRLASRARASGSVTSRSSAAARAATSPAGTSTPSTPSRTISRGPEGQSKLTTGTPEASASHSAIGNASERDERTNTSAAASAASASAVIPGMRTRS
jgi:hypothetical protein